MTSYVLKAHEERGALPESWRVHPRCPFCDILHGKSLAYKVYEDDKTIAILDIAPLRPGHTLVIPKPHIPRVSELPDEFAAACGLVVSKVARAIAGALQNTSLNVVCNQEYAQAVPHVHYHIIPAPRSGSNPGASASTTPGVVGDTAERRDRVTMPLTEQEIHWRELEVRSQLDEGDAMRLVESIRAHL
ncbi:HIT-like domain-containing protein [Dichomitus squalens]|uniref:HIT-like domain-containing protein n=1 Tax=Dichomitus squalens TaxID=114155 RepID=A0A4Q9MS60_9APHY|nr:HIT-like domain-containing protein [Dichomitus squalens]